MSAAEVLAAHQWLFDNRRFCICGAEMHYDPIGADINGARTDDLAIAAHQLDALKAAGYAVVERRGELTDAAHRIRALAADCVAHGDMTPMAKIQWNKLADSISGAR